MPDGREVLDGLTSVLNGQIREELDRAGLSNPHVRTYVRFWPTLTRAHRVEVITAAADGRLVAEALAAGELLPAGQGRYYSRSYHKDTVRSEERTIVATGRPEDRGVYRNWHLAAAGESVSPSVPR